MLITNEQELEYHCSKINKEQFIAIDTEFMRNKTYYPIPCLLQIAYSEAAFAIDLLQPINLQSIKEILRNKKIKKVFHSCKQDLEVLNIVFGTLPSNIFDTQIAAQFLGFEITPSYNKLVEKYLGQTVSKDLQFSNWQSRPLSDVQIKYAIDDVTHLYEIYILMQKELVAKKYLSWVNEEFKKPEKLTNSPANAEALLGKYLSYFSDKEILAKCFMLLKAREEIASQKNVVKSSILKDPVLLKILNGKTIHNLNAKLRKVLEESPSKEAYSVVSNLIAKSKKRKKPDMLMVANLKLLLKKVSEDFGISASLIANSDAIATIASNKKRGLKINSGWRKKIFGRLALGMVKGDINITVVDNQIILNKHNA